MLALLCALLLAVSGIACGRDTTSPRTTGRAKAQEPRSVRVVAAALESLPRTVTVTGTLAADKDFGSGYAYSVIVENSTIKVEEKAKPPVKMP